MSLANAKTEKGAPPKAATGVAPAMAVVQPTPAAQDQNHGRGGHYTVVKGVRQRIAGTAQTAVNKD